MTLAKFLTVELQDQIAENRMERLPAMPESLSLI